MPIVNKIQVQHITVTGGGGTPDPGIPDLPITLTINPTHDGVREIQVWTGQTSESTTMIGTFEHSINTTVKVIEEGTYVKWKVICNYGYSVEGIWYAEDSTVIEDNYEIYPMPTPLNFEFKINLTLEYNQDGNFMNEAIMNNGEVPYSSKLIIYDDPYKGNKIFEINDDYTCYQVHYNNLNERTTPGILFSMDFNTYWMTYNEIEITFSTLCTFTIQLTDVRGTFDGANGGFLGGDSCDYLTVDSQGYNATIKFGGFKGDVNSYVAGKITSNAFI